MAWSCDGRAAHGKRRDGRETEMAAYWRRLAFAEQCRADRHEYKLAEMRDEALMAADLIAELRRQLRQQHRAA